MEKSNSFGKSQGENRNEILKSLRLEISKVLCIKASWNPETRNAENYVMVFDSYKEHQGVIEGLVKDAGLEVRDSFEPEDLIEYFKELTDIIGDTEFNLHGELYRNDISKTGKYFSPSWDAIVKIRERCNKEIRIEPEPVETEDDIQWKKNLMESLRREIVKVLYIKTSWDPKAKAVSHKLVLDKNYKDRQRAIEDLVDESELKVRDTFDKEALIQYMEDLTKVIGDVEIGHYKYYDKINTSDRVCTSPSCECLRKDPPIQKENK